MTPTIPLAPPLDPSDLAHVPRWLDELAWVEAKADHCLKYPGSPMAGKLERLFGGALATDHARWGGEAKR